MTEKITTCEQFVLQQLYDAQDEIAELKKMIALLQSENAALKEKVKELEII